MRLFLKDLEILTSAGSPFEKLNVMIHLDHIQWDDDLELLDWDMGLFSSVMYDASTLPFDKNIEKTAEFRNRNFDTILIEGACDEIGYATDAGITTLENAKRYNDETGVDIMVANLGTEHRASSSELKYRGELAREISRDTGAKLCLHGTSSVAPDELANLFDDGIRKVNIWTALERDSSVPLFKDMVKNASKVIGQKNVQELFVEGFLGSRCDLLRSASVDFCTTTYRQGIVFNTMKKLILNYLDIFYKV
jgi:fructose-bisphosphate aldolase class II